MKYTVRAHRQAVGEMLWQHMQLGCRAWRKEMQGRLTDGGCFKPLGKISNMKVGPSLLG